MKPFKFRVWHKPSKTWVSTEIVLCYDGKMDVCTTHENLDIPNNENFEISYSTSKTSKNKLEVYQNDILQDNDGNFLTVEFCEMYQYLYLKKNVDFFNDKFSIVHIADMFKIGNKYENPELLKDC